MKLENQYILNMVTMVTKRVQLEQSPDFTDGSDIDLSTCNTLHNTIGRDIYTLGRQGRKRNTGTQKTNTPGYVFAIEPRE